MSASPATAIASLTADAEAEWLEGWITGPTELEILTVTPSKFTDLDPLHDHSETSESLTLPLVLAYVRIEFDAI